MPSKLVHTAGMVVVSGSKVNERYCALYCSWNQSEDMKYDYVRDKQSRIDNGKYTLIRPKYDSEADYYDNVEGDNHYTHQNNETREEHVHFKRIIWQICHDFNIRYIWFNQMCIDQENIEEKRREYAICIQYTAMLTAPSHLYLNWALKYIATVFLWVTLRKK